MKNSLFFFSLLFIFYAFDLKGQKLLLETLTIDSISLEKLYNTHTTVLLCNKRGYWLSQAPYILIEKKHHWELIYWEKKIFRESFIRIEYCFKKKRIVVKRQEILSALSFLKEPQFWALEDQLLNSQQRSSSNDSSSILMIDCCSTDFIEIFQNKKHKKCNSYCADFYQGTAPNEHRAYFIDCRNSLTNFIDQLLKNKKKRGNASYSTL